MFSDHLTYGPRTMPHWARLTHPRLPGMRHVVVLLADATAELHKSAREPRRPHVAERRLLRIAGRRAPLNADSEIRAG